MTTAINEQEVRNVIASNWWIPLTQGVAAILFGIYAFTRTGQTMATILFILGLYWIFNGIFSIIAAIRGNTEKSRLWQLIGGVLSIVAGGFAVSHPLMAGAVSASFVGTLIGLSAIISGITQMIVGREVMDGAGRDWSLGSFFLGLLNVIFGIIIMGAPVLAFATFIRILSFWAIIAGIGLIFAAFRVRSIGK